ncbi:HAMP domain-containing protein [Thermogemmatispora onikobensis]|uniref:HAMP domain-containing protein n=1 Tax=Thermogemmatispora onikobensis TaxID=732234 RepID=UPI000852AB9A|nr:hypothetical protein [Thermogemmatispora onikobensis]
MSPPGRIGTAVLVGLSLIVMAAVWLPPSFWPFAISASAMELAVALLAGLFGLGAALVPVPERALSATSFQPWSGQERAAWLCVGGGLLLRAVGVGWQLIGEVSSSAPGTLVRALPTSVLQVLQLIPQVSLLFFPLLLCFSLFLWPAASAGRGRLLLALDVLLALLAMVGLAWNLGIFASLSWPLTFNSFPWETLIDPLADLLLMGAGVLLLLRLATASDTTYRQPPRRVSLLCLVAGLLLYALADLLLHRVLGGSWPGPEAWRQKELATLLAVGLLLCGLAAYLRRVVTSRPADAIKSARLPGDEALLTQLSARPVGEGSRSSTLWHLPLCLPSLLLIACCAVVVWQAWQSAQPPLFTGLLILGLAVLVACLRLLLTVGEQGRLRRLLLRSYQEELQQLETQLYSASRRSNGLEAQLARLREVLARLAAGDLAARLEPVEEELRPLALSLNQLADREMRLELWNEHNQLVRRALEDLCAALERCPAGEPLIIPASCEGVPPIERLLAVTGLRQFAEQPRQSATPGRGQSVALPPLVPPGLPATGEPQRGVSTEKLPAESLSLPIEPPWPEEGQLWL